MVGRPVKEMLEGDPETVFIYERNMSLLFICFYKASENRGTLCLICCFLQIEDADMSTVVKAIDSGFVPVSLKSPNS